MVWYGASKNDGVALADPAEARAIMRGQIVQLNAGRSHVPWAVRR
jgi:hypothetical protein